MSSDKEHGPILRLLQALCPCGTTPGEEDEEKIEITVENTAGELITSAQYKRTKFNRIVFRLPVAADPGRFVRKTGDVVFRPGYDRVLKYQVDDQHQPINEKGDEPHPETRIPPEGVPPKKPWKTGKELARLERLKKELGGRSEFQDPGYYSQRKKPDDDPNSSRVALL